MAKGVDTQPSVEILTDYLDIPLINLTVDFGVITLITQAGDS
jgi:hypothetical protein